MLCPESNDVEYTEIYVFKGTHFYTLYLSYKDASISYLLFNNNIYRYQLNYGRKTIALARSVDIYSSKVFDNLFSRTN